MSTSEAQSAQPDGLDVALAALTALCQQVCESKEKTFLVASTVDGRRALVDMHAQLRKNGPVLKRMLQQTQLTEKFLAGVLHRSRGTVKA